METISVWVFLYYSVSSNTTIGCVKFCIPYALRRVNEKSEVMRFACPLCDFMRRLQCLIRDNEITTHGVMDTARITYEQTQICVLVHKFAVQKFVVHKLQS